MRIIRDMICKELAENESDVELLLVLEFGIEFFHELCKAICYSCFVCI